MKDFLKQEIKDDSLLLIRYTFSGAYDSFHIMHKDYYQYFIDKLSLFKTKTFDVAINEEKDEIISIEDFISRLHPLEITKNTYTALSFVVEIYKNGAVELNEIARESYAGEALTFALDAIKNQIVDIDLNKNKELIEDYLK